MSLPRRTVSVVVPVFNEEENLERLYRELTAAWRPFSELVAYELIFVDDGSTDTSVDRAIVLCGKDPAVRLIELSRNFGKEAAVAAGLQRARGDAVIIMDADLQHPPELIHDFVTQWQQGAEVVVGVRRTMQRRSRISRLESFLFYALMRAISEQSMTPYATDFCLLDRRVVTELNRFPERGRMTRGIIEWLGFRRVAVPFDAPSRAEGVPGFDTWKRIHLALSSLVSHSLFPLKLAGYFGVLIMALSGALGCFIFIEKYVLNDALHMAFSGSAILAVINVFLTGIMLSSLGLVALYVASIHNEVMGRPLFVVRDTVNLD